MVEKDDTTAFGRVLGYSGNSDLFIYLGLVYTDNGLGRIYPSSFLFGTDLDRNKLETFLDKVQVRRLHYTNRKNVIEPDRRWEHSSGPDLLMTCVLSHKARTRGLYDELSSLEYNTQIELLKSILDKKSTPKP